MRVLGRVVTVPSPSKDVAFVVALDWTKTAVAGRDSRDWPNTEVYELIAQGKYLYWRPGDDHRQRNLGRQLAGLLSAVVDEHPLLRTFDMVASVPGHDSKRLSFGARLADTLARSRGMPHVACTCRNPYRTPAKNVPLGDRRSRIHGTFSCPADVTGQDLLIVDDVYSTGSTVAETARALRVAGAQRVASLCGARTLRSTADAP